MWWVGRYSINDSGAENKDDLPPTIQEQLTQESMEVRIADHFYAIKKQLNALNK